MKGRYYVLIGLLVIGGIVFFTIASSKEVVVPQVGNTYVSSNYEAIEAQFEAKIKSLESHNVTPELYNKYRLEILNYTDLDKTIRENLQNELKERYIEKSRERAQGLLSKDPEQSSAILEHLRTIRVEDRAQVKQLKEISTKLKWYYHYIQKLPNEIEDFCAQENIQIEEQDFQAQRQKLSISYNEFKKNQKLLTLKEAMENKLQQRKDHWSEEKMEIRSIYDKRYYYND